MASRGPENLELVGRRASPIRLALGGFALAALLCPIAAGCQGGVGDPGTDMVNPPPPPTPTGTGGTTVIPPAGTDPGRVTLHRLNKVEYNNTVSDLIGTPLRPADALPADSRGAGYDNIAESLTLSDTMLQLYHNAAESISDVALGAQRAKLVTCDVVAMGDACVRNVLKAFARRAWRRPVADADVERLMAVAATAKAQGDPVDVGLKLAVQAVLVSPYFLFRVELDPTPDSLTPHLLTDHEIASRLSYFLWSTMPDDELFAAADAGKLHDKDGLQAQVTRMLKSSKASALIENFGGQWLLARGVTGADVDKNAFPKFDPAVRDAMLKETQLLLKDVAFGGGSTQELLNANYTYLNDRLATHYGLPAVGSAELKRVTLTDTTRGGILAQGSFLTVTSHSDRTSPVNRGRAILEQLLCTQIPDPPPGVAMLETSMTGTTLREKLESHRADPKCAACHDMMDPLGFGLENYDAVGAYRMMEAGKAVDSSGKYLDGQKFTGARELAALIAKDKRFVDCTTTQLYTYALGRVPSQTKNHMDPNIVATLARDFSANGFKFETLIQRLVAADTFLKRRGEPVTGGAP